MLKIKGVRRKFFSNDYSILGALIFYSNTGRKIRGRLNLVEIDQYGSSLNFGIQVQKNQTLAKVVMLSAMGQD